MPDQTDGEVDSLTPNPNASHAGIWSLDIRDHIRAGHRGETDGVIHISPDRLPDGRVY